MNICIFSIPASRIHDSGFFFEEQYIYDTAACFPSNNKKSSLYAAESELEQTFLSFKKEELTLLIW